MDSLITGIEIRRFTPDDYVALTRLNNLTYSDFQKEKEELRFRDESNPPHCRWERWVAESDGHVIGFAGYYQNPGSYHPRKFTLWLGIDPEWYGRGTGRRLYRQVLDAIELRDPLTLDAWTRDDMPCRVGFLERRGFVRDMLLWTSVLDLTGFDAARFGDAVPAVEAQGIQLRSVADLEGSDPDVRGKMFDLWLELREDVPMPPGDQRSEVPYERWAQRHDRPEFYPAGYFVAVDGDRFVGTSQLWHSPWPDTLRTGMTGVRRAYRRRGIALALKVHSLQFVRALGYRRVLTENESNNTGMLGINERLGFVKNPAWIHYLKTFGPSDTG